jgi:hypothetical protein
LDLTKVEREKSHSVADYPKGKEPAIKRPGFAGQKTAHGAKKNAMTPLIR